MSLIETKTSKNLGVITIANPPMNFLPLEVLESLVEGFNSLKYNPEVEVIIITGQGISFVAGVDVKFIHASAMSGDREAVSNLLTKMHKAFNEMNGGQKPVIAAVNGYCFGGGLELALACDYIVCSTAPTVQFSCPEISLGIIPGLGATQRLPRRIDPKYALRMLLGGRSFTVDAVTAKQIKLVDEVIEGDFIGGIKSFAAQILSGYIPRQNGRDLSVCESCTFNHFDRLTQEEFLEFANGNPKSAAELVYKVVRDGGVANLQEALFNVELPALLSCLFGEDAKEGLSAFVEKRKPVFKSVIGQKQVMTLPATSSEKNSTIEVPREYALLPPWEKEEYQMLRDTVREFVDRELKWEKVRQMEEKEEIPRELLSKMGEIGFFGVAFSEEYGGTGLGKIGVCILADELTYAHPATAVVLGAHSSLGCEAIYLFGNEDQKQRYLVPGIKGEKIGALVTTEPGVGSDVGGMKTLAKKVDGGWRLNGSKQFVTSGEIADFIVTFAQTDPLGGNKTLAAFIVDSTPELRSKMKRERKMGIHASKTNSFPLEEIFVPDANLLGEVGNGFKMVMNIFNHSRVTVAASSIGFIRRAIDEAVKYSKNRMLFGEPMYMKQLTQVALAEMEVMRFSVESAVLQAAWRVDRGLDVRNEAAAVKYFGPESAKRAVDMSVQLHGGSGYISDYPIEMFYRDVRIFPLFEGTSQIQLLTIAKEMIKSRIL